MLIQVLYDFNGLYGNVMSNPMKSPQVFGKLINGKFIYKCDPGMFNHANK